MTPFAASVLAEAPASFRWADYRYRLVPLLEIVKRINAGELFQLSFLLGRRSVFLPELEGGDHSPERWNRAFNLDQLETAKKVCEDAGLPVSRVFIENLIGAIRGEDRSAGAVSRIKDLYQQVHLTLQTELAMPACLVLESSNLHYYDSPLDGWTDAVVAFPSCAADIKESSKGLALDRPTASVFHSVRVAEASLRALASFLGIQNSNPSWDVVLGRIEKLINSPYAELDERWKGTGDLKRIREAWVWLTAMQQGVRNPVMHVEGFYSAEEADDLYRIVRSFMRSVSSWLTESGPRAAT